MILTKTYQRQSPEALGGLFSLLKQDTVLAASFPASELCNLIMMSARRKLPIAIERGHLELL